MCVCVFHAFSLFLSKLDNFVRELSTSSKISRFLCRVSETEPFEVKNKENRRRPGLYKIQCAWNIARSWPIFMCSWVVIIIMVSALLRSEIIASNMMPSIYNRALIKFSLNTIVRFVWNRMVNCWIIYRFENESIVFGPSYCCSSFVGIKKRERVCVCVW